MSEADANPDFLPRPTSLAAPPRRAQAAPRLRRVRRPRPATALPLASALSFDRLPYPLDPPLEEVHIPGNEPHAAATAYSRNALRHQFPGAHVGDDLMLKFSEPGKAAQSLLAPDVSVALGVPSRGDRASYDADVLGPPDFVLEVLSPSTWKHDLGRKLGCYQRIGVRECLLFDVTRANRAGHGKELWGFALTPERRRPLPEVVLPNGERGVYSEVLGLAAYVAERTPPSAPRGSWVLTMRWHDPATAADIPDYEQARAQADAADYEARAERARANVAQREAQAERDRADAAQRETQAERDRADAAQRRIAELEEQLRQLRGGS